MSEPLRTRALASTKPSGDNENTGGAGGTRPPGGTGDNTPDGLDASGAHGRLRDLALGLRFALTGGRRGWIRTGLTAVGVGLGVCLLLMAASIPSLMDARETRQDARKASSQDPGKPTADSFLYATTFTDFRADSIKGMIVRPDGDGPTAAPPGLAKLPGLGEMAVSPALAELLATPGGKLLKERLPYRITAAIGKEGLAGPGELFYYAGVPALTEDRAHGRTTDFGNRGYNEPLDPVLLLIVVMACVALLMPVAVFIATAVRFGGEQRDRRLAALRMVGADRAMTRRIAAGESLGGALLGLLVGAGLFALLRSLAGSVTLWNINVFPADIVPHALLVALIAVAVPASAIAVSLFALRGVAIEPLGVVRNAAKRRRRLWWRLPAPFLGLALLIAELSGVSLISPVVQTGAGAALVLLGITVLLPWLVESVVRRLDGGPVPWQLAVRRLQLSSDSASRAVSGIVVAAAGAIALQMLFSSVQDDFVQASGRDVELAQLEARIETRDGDEAREMITAYAKAKGVDEVIGMTETHITRLGPLRAGEDVTPFTALTVADCPSLRALAKLPSCKDGDVFTLAKHKETVYDYFPRPGTRVNLAREEYGSDGRPLKTEPALWRIPDTARQVESRVNPSGMMKSGVLATPSAVDLPKSAAPMARVMVRVDETVPDAIDHARNAGAAFSPLAVVETYSGIEENSQFANVRTGVLLGATATMALIAVSMLVSMLEQLRERRRLLSVLVAFGTRRSTLSWSVLWQTAVPIALGLALAVVGGMILGTVLVMMAGSRVADWWVFLPIVGVGAALVALVTLLSLPPLWRMMRPDGLRTE